MDTEKGKVNFISQKIADLLLKKPLWVWWIFYIVLTGLLFGFFNFILYLLTIKWVIGILILLAVGIIWGTIQYMHMKDKNKNDEKEAEKSAT